MKQLKLSVTERTTRGSASAGRMRRQGIIPAVIYGQGANTLVAVLDGDFRRLMRAAAGSAALIELVGTASDQSMLSIIKAIHRDPVTDKLLHVDFNSVSENEPMHIQLPVHVEGESFGVKNENGVLEVLLHDIEVRCLPKDLPEYISVDVSQLKTGEAIHVHELKPISGVVFEGDSNRVVIACTSGNKAIESAEAEPSVEGAANKEAVSKEATKTKEKSKSGS